VTLLPGSHDDQVTDHVIDHMMKHVIVHVTLMHMTWQAMTAVAVGDPVESVCCQFGDDDLMIVAHDDDDNKSKCQMDKMCALINNWV
jgi:hypothetical protein